MSPASHRSLVRFLLLCQIFGGVLVHSLAADESGQARIEDVRGLSPGDAAQARPVKVRGVIVWTNGSPVKSFAIADDSAAIYVNVVEARAHEVWKGDDALLAGLHMGQEIDLEGVTNPGGYAPVIWPARWRVLGEKPLPTAKPASMTRLLSGTEDAQWVEVEGVVQAVMQDPLDEKRRILRVSGDGGYFLVMVDPAAWNDESAVVDAAVRVRGLAMALLNSRREITGMRVSVRRAEDLTIVEPPRADPFTAPRLQLEALRPFNPRGETRHRCVIEGTVTLGWLNMLYLQAHDRGLRLSGVSGDTAVPGDHVEVSGFVEPGRGVASMSNAVVRRTGRDGLPAPLATSPGEILQLDREHAWAGWAELPADHDGRRVQIDGTIVAVRPPDPLGNSRIIYLNTDSGQQMMSRIIEAQGVNPAVWTNGARVRLTGVAVIQYSPGYSLPELIHPNYMEMLVRNGEDVTLLATAPWWTVERLGLATGVLALLLVGAGAGVAVLQRLLQQRTLRLEQVMQSHRNSELEMKGAREERFRLAADLHDSLQQQLTGASYRLEAALMRLGEPPPGVQEQFAAARAALDRTRTGLRETLFALRKVEEGPAEFPALLRHAAEKMEHWPKDAIEIVTTGDPFPLSRHVMGSLLLFMQEAVANALRHGAATEVRVVLNYAPDSLEMRVEDNGSGFNPEEVQDASAGHFGLGSMRDRLRWLGGAAEIRSEAGEGTAVIARLARNKAEANNPQDAMSQEGETA